MQFFARFFVDMASARVNAPLLKRPFCRPISAVSEGWIPGARQGARGVRVTEVPGGAAAGMYARFEGGGE